MFVGGNAPIRHTTDTLQIQIFKQVQIHGPLCEFVSEEGGKTSRAERFTASPGVLVYYSAFLDFIWQQTCSKNYRSLYVDGDSCKMTVVTISGKLRPFFFSTLIFIFSFKILFVMRKYPYNLRKIHLSHNGKKKKNPALTY